MIREDNNSDRDNNNKEEELKVTTITSREGKRK